MTRILGIVGSPRKGSNSTALLEQILAGAEAEGAGVEVIEPAKLEIAPCRACANCSRGGCCNVKDDFQGVYDEILACDALVLATPVYFGAVSAQVKPLIDRCESFWTATYAQKDPLPPAPSGRRRQGVLIATAGQDREIMFKGPRVTFEFLMRSMQGQVYGELCYGDLDERGAIRRNAMAMARAQEMGRRLALGLEPEGGRPAMTAGTGPSLEGTRR
jgi:multimeric flavodoxin WrbA